MLFAKFSVIWPRDWADRVAMVEDIDLLAAEWSEGLAGMTGPQIGAAIRHLRATSPWAPSIAAFREAGMDGTPEQRAFAARCREEQLALPSRTWAESKAAGAEHARNLLAMLRGEQTQGAH